MLHAENHCGAETARRIGAHRSTIGRELLAASSTFPDQRAKYRASVAQAAADRRAARAAPGKLAACPSLAAEVAARLEAERSPEQISARLKMDFPDDEDMRVSHETIYRALYVQGRGELRRDLHQRLRTGRALRRTRRVRASVAVEYPTWSASPSDPLRSRTGPCPGTGRAT